MMGLQHYDINIQYKKGSKMYLADTLNCHHLEKTNNVETVSPAMNEAEGSSSEIEVSSVIQGPCVRILKLKIQGPCVTFARYVHSRGTCRCRWSNKYQLLTNEATLKQKAETTKDKDVQVPTSLIGQMWIELHSANQGLDSSMRRARESICCGHINHDLRDHIGRCDACSTYHDKQPKEPLVSHEVPNRAWARVGCDLMEFDNKNYLVTVNYFSNFFEIDCLEQATTNHVTKKLKAHFARYGIPETIVTDNGAQFISMPN